MINFMKNFYIPSWKKENGNVDSKEWFVSILFEIAFSAHFHAMTVFYSAQLFKKI